MKRTNKRGFTLVELMIALAILAILTAIAVPGYRSLMTLNRLKGAARQVMVDLANARMEAVSRNNAFKVTFIDDHRYSILNDANGNGTADSGETVTTKDIQVNYSDVTLNATAHPVFTPRGTASAATVTLTNGQGSRTVTVFSTGRVAVS